jgi:hypothetical protein
MYRKETAVPDPTPPVTVEDREKERAAEYGTYVATGPILIDGARAFNAGDPVPASHVSGGVVREDQVAKVTTKAGRVAAGIEPDNTPKG